MNIVRLMILIVTFFTFSIKSCCPCFKEPVPKSNLLDAKNNKKVLLKKRILSAIESRKDLNLLYEYQTLDGENWNAPLIAWAVNYKDEESIRLLLANQVRVNRRYPFEGMVIGYNAINKELITRSQTILEYLNNLLCFKEKEVAESGFKVADMIELFIKSGARFHQDIYTWQSVKTEIYDKYNLTNVKVANSVSDVVTEFVVEELKEDKEQVYEFHV